MFVGSQARDLRCKKHKVKVFSRNWEDQYTESEMWRKMCSWGKQDSIWELDQISFNAMKFYGRINFKMSKIIDLM